MSEPAIDTILIIVRCRRNKVEHGESHAYWSEMSSDRIPKDTLVINTGRIRQDQIRSRTRQMMPILYFARYEGICLGAES